ncbi:hypothetical protein ACVOMV_27230 (plasmid) [Mesorhizobium atlanticum]
MTTPVFLKRAAMVLRNLNSDVVLAGADEQEVHMVSLAAARIRSVTRIVRASSFSSFSPSVTKMTIDLFLSRKRCFCSPPKKRLID